MQESFVIVELKLNGQLHIWGEFVKILNNSLQIHYLENVPAAYGHVLSFS